MHHWASQCDTVKQYKAKKNSTRHGQKSKNFKKSGSPKDKNFQQSQTGKHKKVNRAYEDYESDDSEVESIHVQVVRINKVSRPALADILIKSPKASMTIQIDSGAEANVLPTRCFEQMYPNSMSNG